jgi:hypothetical protein
MNALSKIRVWFSLDDFRSRQLKHQNIKDKSDLNDALAEAFENGYRLGRSDGREGVFIDLPLLVTQYTDSLAVNIKLGE